MVAAATVALDASTAQEGTADGPLRTHRAPTLGGGRRRRWRRVNGTLSVAFAIGSSASPSV